MPAALDDPVGLRAVAAAADVSIHCAGPFAATCEPVAVAAVKGVATMSDHSVEVHTVKRLFDTFQESAQRAGITMLPSVSFYGGVEDLLAGAVGRGVSGHRADYSPTVSNWMMTTGGRVRATAVRGYRPDRLGRGQAVQLRVFVYLRMRTFVFSLPVVLRSMIAPVPFPGGGDRAPAYPDAGGGGASPRRTFEEEQA
ncbi:hypothetical protein ACTAF0_08975 [Streptomyces murinus]|uniref:hypothetical protein n=1 Tax=Streptomyces murinus TaxID=33900 RepID=UPI003F4726CB